jgi:hypothetical protein
LVADEVSPKPVGFVSPPGGTKLVKYACPSCGARLKIPAMAKRVRCPKCAEIFSPRAPGTLRPRVSGLAQEQTNDYTNTDLEITRSGGQARWKLLLAAVAIVAGLGSLLSAALFVAGRSGKSPPLAQRDISASAPVTQRETASPKPEFDFEKSLQKLGVPVDLKGASPGQIRWLILFDPENPARYARQLQSLHASLVFRGPDGRLVVVDDLLTRPIVPKYADMAKIKPPFWLDSNPKSVLPLAKDLGIAPPNGKSFVPY